MDSIFISIIIPTYNESEHIGELINYLKKNSKDISIEILVIDAGSNDNTVEAAQNAGARVFLSSKKGRAVQMNYGAFLAQGNVLYFVHADTTPPASFANDIMESIEKGSEMGRYLSTYKSKSWLLKLNAYFSRFDLFAGMGGDQTLFITKKLFISTGGFNKNMAIMEDFEFCTRARKAGRYKVIHKKVLISARKYQKNTWLTVQIANYTIVKMYKNGASQEAMVEKYNAMLQNR